MTQLRDEFLDGPTDSFGIGSNINADDAWTFRPRTGTGHFARWQSRLPLWVRLAEVVKACGFDHGQSQRTQETILSAKAERVADPLRLTARVLKMNADTDPVPSFSSLVVAQRTSAARGRHVVEAILLVACPP